MEQGRWRARGSEAASKFSASSNMVASKGLRMNSLIGNQAGVWRQVGDVQGKLSSNLGAVVNASGQVVASRVLRSTLGSARVEQCIARAARQRLYPWPAEPWSVRLNGVS